MGVKGTDFVLKTQHPTKTDMQKATTDSNRAKAVVASHEQFDAALYEDPPEGAVTSNSGLSQLTE